MTGGGSAGDAWVLAGGGSAGHASLFAGDGGRAGDASLFAGGGGVSGKAGMAGASDAAPLLVEPGVLPDARFNKAYAARLSANGGTGQGYRFELSSGTLPLGLVLGEDGTLAGIPAEVGDFWFSVTVVDSARSYASRDLALQVRRSRWLAMLATAYSSSDQWMLGMQDLEDLDAPLVTLEAWSAFGPEFSPDGRWLYYGRVVDETTSELRALDTSSAELGDTLSLGAGAGQSSCLCSPDSTQLVCPERFSEMTRIKYFDLLRSEAQPRGFLAHGFTSLDWLGDRRFSYITAEGELMFVDTSGPIVAAPESSGVYFRLFRLSNERDRAIARDTRPGAAPSWVLLDLSTLAYATLPSHDAWDYSASLRAAVAVDSGARSADPATHYYYDLGDLDVRRLDTREVEGPDKGSDIYSPRGDFAGERYFELRNGVPAITTLGATGLTTSICPGEVPEVSSFYPLGDASGLVFDHREELQDGSSSCSWWLARVVDGTLQAPRALGPAMADANLFVSPDSSKAVLVGNASASDPSATARVIRYDLSTSDPVEQQTHDLPHEGVWPVWSGDSSYLALVGSSANHPERALYVVDALDPKSVPRLALICGSTPGPAVGCPASVVFQP